jgi:ribonuclease HI
MAKPKVKIYTDGACANNPGKGGYGIVLMCEKQDGSIVQKNLSRGFELTTNNRMELLAVIDALNALKNPCEIELYSDSKYVVDAINQNWLSGWVLKNWKLNTKNPVKNIDLWEKLLIAMKPHDIKFIWVKGHASNEYNNLCDKLAVEARSNENLEIDSNYEP